MQRIDLTGQKFHKLTVIKFSGLNRTSAEWLCLCDCGNQCLVIGNKLRNGHTKSCSCNQKEITSKRFKKHGQTNSTEYKSWQSMKARCYDKNNIGYNDYGGKGIKVSERWVNSFANFLEDMGFKPTKKHTLDRISFIGNYEKLNCRWATTKEQNGNTSRNVWVEYNGEIKIIADWAKHFNVKVNSVRYLMKCKPGRNVFDSLNKKLNGSNSRSTTSVQTVI